MPLMAAALILSGCCTKSELEEVKQEVSSLTERVASIENTQLKALESQIASIQKEIAELQNADKVHAEDVSALEGKMSVISDDLAQLKESVSSLDGTTEELSGKISDINAKLSELESQITSILASINELKARVSSGYVTLSYIPKYADNNEPVNYTRDALKISGTATLNFNVQPSSAAETITKDWKTSLSTIAVYTLTKATGGESVELAVSDASAKDGILSVKIDVDKLGKDFILGDIGAALAVKVS
jgi:prefoldin subunit 5